MAANQIVEAIKAGDKTRARHLLAPALKAHPSPAVFCLAARVAVNREQAGKFLERALDLNPDYEPALTMLHRLDATTPRPNTLTRRTLKNEAEQMLIGVTSLFRRYGWQVVAQSTDKVEFAKRKSISKGLALALSLLFNIVGVVLVLALIARSKTEQVTTEAAADGSVLTTTKDFVGKVHSPYELTWLAESVRGIGFRQAAVIGCLSLASWGVALFVLPLVLNALGVNVSIRL